MHRIRTIQATAGMAWLGAVMAIETMRTAAAARPGLSRKLVLAAAIMLVGTNAPLRAQMAGPRLMFADIESGPKTGGQSNLGAFISIYGEGFGATQGSSTVTIGGQPVASVTSWGQDNAARDLDRIVVQPGPGAASGNIVVTVGGQASNGLPFTVRAGNIYFVNQATGNDGNPGSYAQPWKTIWHARDAMVAGDTVYVIGGTFNQMDPYAPGWDTLLFLDAGAGSSGTASAPIAYLGYPGNPPFFQNDASRRGIYFNQDAGPLNYIVIGNVRIGSGMTEDAIPLSGIGHRIVGNNFSNGGVGNGIEVLGNTSAIEILGNLFDSNGTPATKEYSIYIAGFGINRDIDVGWNEIKNQQGGRAMQVFGHVAGDRVEDLRIHDNELVGSELNNIVMGNSDGGTEILGTVTVTGNIIAGSASQEGLRINDPQGTVIIENNTFYGNAVAQVYLERAGAGRITLRNNIIVAQAGQQYYEFDAGSSSASFAPANNLVFGAGPCDAWDAGCINQDPLFAGASDYHLQSGSPAIDQGVATSVSRDHDGIPRPQGAAFDIGAYEYYSHVPVCRVSCSATVPPSAGVGDTVSFQSSATLLDCAGGSVSYAWDFGDGSTSSEQNPTHAYATDGAYPWSLTTTAPGAVACGQSGTIGIGSAAGSADLTGSWTKITRKGSKINATFSCQNTGSAAAGSFMIRFYFSRKASAGSKSTLFKSQSVGALAAGASVALKVSGTPTSKHKYIIAVVDALDAVFEDDESDNTIARRLP
ncbi:MAG: PKD domain-containing protein [Acidobacteria bacterium]|nr:PKD domain-containing protein [Acidobacteriota bacterium]